MGSPDGQLAAAVRAVRAEGARRSSPELDALARRSARLSLQTAGALVATREEADDISQDVTIAVLRSIEGLRDPAAFDGWVHRITVRTAMKSLRRRKRRRDCELPLALQSPGRLPHVPDDAELVALRGALGAALADLTDRQRLAVALRYVHDLPDAEIAEALGCRVGTVGALLSRARETLRSNTHLEPLSLPTQEVSDG